MVISRLESAPRNDLDSDSQEFLKVLEQADVIKKGGAWLEIHEQVQVPARSGLSPGHRAEYCDPVSPVLTCDREDLRAAATQHVHGEHAVGHVSRISPRTRVRLWTRSRLRTWYLGYGRVVPRVSAFYGVVIYMYWNERDHPIAHFHAYHAGRRASVSADGVVLAGSLESRALGFVQEWASLRHDEIVAEAGNGPGGTSHCSPSRRCPKIGEHGRQLPPGRCRRRGGR